MPVISVGLPICAGTHLHRSDGRIATTQVREHKFCPLFRDECMGCMTRVVKSIGSVLSLRSLSKPTHSHILIEALFMEMLISNLEEKLYLSLPFCTSTDEAKHSVNNSFCNLCGSYEWTWSTLQG